MAQQNTTEMTSEELAELTEGDEVTVEYSSTQTDGYEADQEVTAEVLEADTHTDEFGVWGELYLAVHRDEDDTLPRRRVRLQAGSVRDLQARRTTRNGAQWQAVSQGTPTVTSEDDEDEAEYQPQDEVEQEMADVAASMGQPEQEAFQEYLAEQREGEDSEDDEDDAATDGGLTHEDVEQALDEVLPLLGTYDSLERDLATVAEGRTDQGWIEVRAEASLDLAQEFAAAMREALPGSAYLEVGGMGTFTVVNY